MDYDKLKAFVKLSEVLNFTKAAKELYIGQPALSRKIADFERELGVTLFIRNNRSVELTQIGKYLYTEARKIIDQMNRLQDDIKKASCKIEGHLLVGSTGVERSYLPKIVNLFKADYPDIRMNMYSFNCSSALKSAIKDKTIDVGFLLGFEVQSFQGVKYRELAREKLCIVLPRDHHLSERSQLELSDLLDETIVLISPSLSHEPYKEIMKFFDENNFSPKKIVYKDSIQDLLLTVEIGEAITLLLRSAKVLLGERLKMIPVANANHNICINVVWNASNSNLSLPIFINYIENIDCEKLMSTTS